MRLSRLTPAIAAVAIVLAVPLVGDRPNVPEALGTPLQPPVLKGCTMADNAESPYWSRLSGADQRVQQIYLCGDELIQLDVAVYSFQAPGKEAITQGNQILDTKYALSALPIEIESADGIRFREYRINSRIQPGLMWSTYAIGDEWEPNELKAKAQEVWNKLMRRNEDTAIISLIAWGQDYDALRQVLILRSQELREWFRQRKNHDENG